MRELLVRGKNTIDPEVIDPGGRSVEDSPVKRDFNFTLDIKISDIDINISDIDITLQLLSSTDLRRKRLLFPKRKIRT
jgi:hypothetical protein